MKLSVIRFATFLALALNLASCSKEDAPEVETPSASNYVVVENYTYSAIENEVLELVNQHRVSKGLSALLKINQISAVSEGHDNYMIANNTVSHDLFSEREANLRATVGAVSVGENVGYNYATAQGVVTAWLNSPAHKANMEGNYTHFGIAVRENAAGKKYYTNIFVRK